YQPEVVLGTGDSSKENLVVYRDGNDFVVKSSGKNITGLEVYDVSGRLMITSKPNQKETRIDASAFINGVYVLKINQEGIVVTKKVIK
ncbi:T9SS type A sorting domain-containing protein, partial [Kaistella carnis]